MNATKDLPERCLHPVCSAWVRRAERLPDVERRILALSPVYPVGHEMRHRMMDARFFRICTEATHWLDVQTIEPNIDIFWPAIHLYP